MRWRNTVVLTTLDKSQPDAATLLELLSVPVLCEYAVRTLLRGS